MNRKVVLVAFYNKKALGVRYLETALKQHGYSVTTVFFKDFNSIRPKIATETEAEKLAEIVKAEEPLFVGYSVMSSLYLESVEIAINGVKKACPDTMTVCGGAFATMFPEELLKRGADIVIRADGEIPVTKLADALCSGEEYHDNPSLCYMKDGKSVINPIGDVLDKIDGYGLPTVECENAYYIEDDTVIKGDPQMDTMSYEVIASRGCPFTCSYCCCVNLRRLMPQGMQHVRSRSVKSVIDELVIAKSKLKKLVFVHFYDEIFPTEPGWVDEFVKEYHEKINLPFTIWSHPKMVKLDEMKKLVKIGLSEVIMGIQSGSDRVRRDVFHRYETQEDVIEATRIIREAGVSWATYDLILLHPFETIDDLKESYYLTKKLVLPFELQLHGLNFLPGTDIVDMAIEQGILTEKQMSDIMYAPMQAQFATFHNFTTDKTRELWFKMIFCLQFKDTKAKVIKFEDDPSAHQSEIEKLYATAQKKAKLHYYVKKSNMVMKRIFR